MKRPRNSVTASGDCPATVPTTQVSKSRHFFQVFHLKKNKNSIPSGARASSDSEREESMVLRKERKEEIFSALSGATSLALSTLNDVATLAPVPYLSEAAGLALGIWNAVQTTRNAKSSLLSLGEDACTLVYTVWTTCDEVLQRQRGAGEALTQPELKAEPREKEGKQDDNLVAGRLDDPIDPDMGTGECGETQDEEGKETEEGEEEAEQLNPHLETNLKQLCSTLHEISLFAKRTASRNVLLRFITSDADTGKVAEYQGRLKSALDLFTLQSHITIQQVISRIEMQQKVMQAQVQMRSLTPHHRPSSGEAIRPTGESVPAKVPVPVSGGGVSEGSSPVPVPPAPTESARAEGLQVGATAFPAIFSFAGATFHTGNTTFTNGNRTHKSKTTSRSHKSPAKPQSNSQVAPTQSAPEHSQVSGNSNVIDIEDQNAVQPVGEGGISSSSVHTTSTASESESEPGIQLGGQDGSGNGNIHFTSITGDQNTSWVNDQSQRWNYGNVYEYDPTGGRQSPDKTLNAVTRRPIAPAAVSSTNGDGGSHDEVENKFPRGGMEGGGRGRPSVNAIAALGKEAFSFGRNQRDNHIQTQYYGNIDDAPTTAATRGRRHPGRGRRAANVNYWDSEGDRDENPDSENVMGRSYGSEYRNRYGEGGNGHGVGEGYRYRSPIQITGRNRYYY
ncbi:hypothetical protein BT96DRAFT_1019654 [Gymnopus androsaceus JB14]|uniref:Uncharacterized protein n=1 Tax=Gymnopus androsaceus JB14 TaxID=1447944 RepID=A0A6A4HL61_9AGAR|nr:hypothetical protein BT96DRAFT_1019654 [Gymnopus androsaceus JB14]